MKCPGMILLLLDMYSVALRIVILVQMTICWYQ